jgi:hypothetical protein
LDMTLEELKAENAKQLAEDESVTATDESEVDEVAVESEVDDSGDAAEHSDSEAENDTEDWLKDDDQASNSDQVPLAALVKTRTKLKGTIKEQVSEIESLRAEVESLKQVQSRPIPTEIKPPRKEDFDYDDERFEAAKVAYIDQLVEARISQVSQKTDVQKKAELAKQKIEEALSDHYGRAEALIKKGSSGITEADYQAADTKLRLAVEQVMPGRGDAVVDTLLASLGNGSEKVGYWAGRNAAAREELQRRLIADPSGIAASIWLGTKLVELSPPKQLRSNAAKPVTQLTGDANSKDPHKALKDKLNKARANGDMQKVIDLRAEAKKAGIDPKTL